MHVCTFRSFKGRRPTQKTTHPNKNSLHKQFAQTLLSVFCLFLKGKGGQFVQTVPKLFAQTVCANCFYLGGWFLGGSSLHESWLSMPNACFFFWDFEGPTDVISPGRPREWPRDVHGISGMNLWGTRWPFTEVSRASRPETPKKSSKSLPGPQAPVSPESLEKVSRVWKMSQTSPAKTLWRLFPNSRGGGPGPEPLKSLFSDFSAQWPDRGKSLPCGKNNPAITSRQN